MPTKSLESISSLQALSRAFSRERMMKLSNHHVLVAYCEAGRYERLE
jgi:hypothetical protein